MRLRSVYVRLPDQGMYPFNESVMYIEVEARWVQLLHPRFVTYIPRDTRVEIRGLVQDVANFLGSPEIAIDDRHGPLMYSHFLHGLLEAPLASVDHSPAALKRAARLLSPQPPPQPDHASDHQPSQESSSTVTPTSNTHSQSTPALTHDPYVYDSLGMQFGSESTQPVDTSGMYAAPLLFDNDLLQSMQTLTDSNWSNMISPGEAISIPGQCCSYSSQS